MRLNHDCIRDILLYIEENTTYENCVLSTDTLREYFSSSYSADTVNYHLKQIHQADLVDNILYSENAPSCVSSLSWKGHEYIDNIRDNKVWRKLKDLSKGLASVSLPVLIEKSPDIVKSLLS